MSNDTIKLNELTRDEYFFGHKACGGCGGSLILRIALKVLGPRTFVAIPAGCMSAVGFIYPQLSFACNAMISTFPGTASMLLGIAAGAKALNLQDYNVVGFAGDGGTADIGIQALSGAIERNDKIIYICYDNEAYMNTGIQRSGLTPFGAKTTTTPAGKNINGNRTHKKNMFEIVAAHRIQYAATASVGFIRDFANKVEKARKVNGASYIHVYAPCPTGWNCDSDITIELGRDVVKNGLWVLAEYENEQFKINKDIKKFSNIREYLSKQGRFKHLSEEDILEIERYRDKEWERIRKHWKN
ncbi:MAG: thiamine pyrophosphate-dependent enzyme [Ignavibacteriaceae bacterium]